MPTFNRSEQIILLLLSAALVIGAGVQVTDHYFSDLPDFHVIKGAVTPPSALHPEQAPEPGSRAESATRTQAPKTVGPVPVDINLATIPQLTTLPRIGPRTAERIHAYREAHGPFKAVEELTQVKGIGPKTLQRLLPHLTLSSP